MRNKILRSANGKYRYFFLLINKLSKEDLSLLHFCVFRSEFIVSVDFLAKPLTPVTPYVCQKVD